MPALGIDRCLILMEVLASYPSGKPLGEIAFEAGIPKSGTHRLLNALVEAGYVTQLPSKDYRLTLKLPSLGFKFLLNTGVPRECQSTLDDIAEDVGELVRLTLVDENRLVWILKAQGARSSLVVDPVPGQDVALHATASGKIWLSSLSTELALSLVLRRGFGSPAEHGPRVIQTVEALQKELSATRTRGYGLAIEEAEPGINAMAVGIRSRLKPDTLIGTLSIAGPALRLSERALTDLLPRLRLAADHLFGLDAFMQFAEAPFDHRPTK